MSLYKWSKDQDECCDLYASMLEEAPDFVAPLIGVTVAVYATLSIGIRSSHGKDVDPSVVADLTKFVTETAYRYQEADQ